MKTFRSTQNGMGLGLYGITRGLRLRLRTIVGLYLTSWWHLKYTLEVFADVLEVLAWPKELGSIALAVLECLKLGFP